MSQCLAQNIPALVSTLPPSVEVGSTSTASEQLLLTIPRMEVVILLFMLRLYLFLGRSGQQHYMARLSTRAIQRLQYLQKRPAILIKAPFMARFSTTRQAPRRKITLRPARQRYCTHQLLRSTSQVVISVAKWANGYVASGSHRSQCAKQALLFAMNQHVRKDGGRSLPLRKLPLIFSLKERRRWELFSRVTMLLATLSVWQQVMRLPMKVPELLKLNMINRHNDGEFLTAL